MHEQVLVIKPKNVELKDVMYWYQEIDKYPHEKVCDERCQFFLTVKDEEIPQTLEKIKEYLIKYRDKYLEVLQYRANHSYQQTVDKYKAFYANNCYEGYIRKCDNLEEYKKAKNGCKVDVIKFIKEWGDYALDKETSIYIEGVGFGYFHNPYQMWDSYAIVNERRFPKNTNFLVSHNYIESNVMDLDDLDVEKTVANIQEFTRVWENIIFCMNDPSKSELFTINDVRFSDEYNKHCLVKDLKKVLLHFSKIENSEEYDVTALDFHW